MQIEPMQPLLAESIYDQFARRKGYRYHHPGPKTDNMKQGVNETEDKGFHVIQNRDRPEVKWAYLNTEEQTVVAFELLENTPPQP